MTRSVRKAPGTVHCLHIMAKMGYICVYLFFHCRIVLFEGLFVLFLFFGDISIELECFG